MWPVFTGVTSRVVKQCVARPEGASTSPVDPLVIPRAGRLLASVRRRGEKPRAAHHRTGILERSDPSRSVVRTDARPEGRTRSDPWTEGEAEGRCGPNENRRKIRGWSEDRLERIAARANGIGRRTERDPWDIRGRKRWRISRSVPNPPRLVSVSRGSTG